MRQLFYFLAHNETATSEKLKFWYHKRNLHQFLAELYHLLSSITQMNAMEGQTVIPGTPGIVGVAMGLTEEWMKGEGYLHKPG